MGKTRLRQAVAALLVLAGLCAAIEPAVARNRMSFVPGRHGQAHGYRHRGARAYAHRGRRPAASARHGWAGRTGSDTGDTVPPPPGSGFKMEDGVLTYPAPARFQPKNLKHL